MSEDPFGILIVDKGKGMTSHDIVDLVRRRFSVKKAGHAGTLDPNATGVLVLLLGKATKLSDRFLNDDKEYAATMKLGERTDSGDRDGKIISVREVHVSETEIRSVMAGFVGETEQTPPMVSAKQINGKRLYKLARKGIEIERSPGKITIKTMEIKDIDLPCVSFTTVCSKGTYIRQLVDDAGEKLNCGAHLTDLRRTRSGQFSIDQAFSLDKLAEMNRDELDGSLLRI